MVFPLIKADTIIDWESEEIYKKKTAAVYCSYVLQLFATFERETYLTELLECFFEMVWKIGLNPLHCNIPFINPLKPLENLRFQGVLKLHTGVKWVNNNESDINTSCIVFVIESFLSLINGKSSYVSYVLLPSPLKITNPSRKIFFYREASMSKLFRDVK